MDRRTQDSKLVGRKLSEMLRQGLVRDAEATELEYVRAERCRICNRDRSDLPNAVEVRILIDRELANNSTCRAALETVEALVAEWPSDQRPTYAAVRNHAKRHLMRDHAVARRLMEAYAVKDDIDVENGEGSILNPQGVLALIMQKGSELVRDGRLEPNINEIITASRVMSTIDSERYRASLEEAHGAIRALVTILQELAPEALASLTGPSSEISVPGRKDIVVVPEAVSDTLPLPSEPGGGFPCDECSTLAKSRGGLLQHKRAKHASVPALM